MSKRSDFGHTYVECRVANVGQVVLFYDAEYVVNRCERYSVTGSFSGENNHVNFEHVGTDGIFISIIRFIITRETPCIMWNLEISSTSSSSYLPF